MNIHNNMQSNIAPSFGAIKSIKCTGLYEKRPDLSKELVDTFTSNPVAMDFCKKYDVDIVFNARKDSQNLISTFYIQYDNPAKSSFSKFVGRSKDKFAMSSYGYNWDIDRFLPEVTEDMKNKIAHNKMGVLDGNLKYIDDEITAKLNEEKQKQVAKQAKKNAEQFAHNKRFLDAAALNDTIKKAMEDSK